MFTVFDHFLKFSLKSFKKESFAFARLSLIIVKKDGNFKNISDFQMKKHELS